MAGLLQQGMTPQQPAQPEPEPPSGEASARAEPGRNPMAPPEQAKPMVKALVERLLTFLYEQGTEQVARVLQKDGNITNQMGKVLGMIMVTVYNAMAQQGKAIPPNVMVQAGMELAKAVGEMAMDLGRLQQGQDAEAIESAFMLGLGTLGKNAEMSQEERQAYRQMIDALVKGRAQAGGAAAPDRRQPAPPAGMIGGAMGGGQ